MMNKLGYYIIHILIGLVITQLLLTSSTSINIIGLILLIIHSFIIFYFLNDHFLFVTYIFSLCIMNSGTKLGGISLAPLLIFISCILVPGRFYVKDRFVKICLLVLVVTNFLGYLVISAANFKEIIQSAIIFTGFILTFLFVQNLKFSEIHFNIILKIFTFLSFLLFLVALNQKFVFIDSSIPLLGAVEYASSSVSSVSYNFYGRLPSLFGDYELFSEFALLMFILSFSFIMDKRTMVYYKFRGTPFILLLFSFMNILITGTRSGFILIFVFLVIFFLFRLRVLFSSTTFKLFLILAILVPFIIQYGDLVGLDIIVNRLKEIDTSNIGVKNIQSGEEMNRAYVYAEGYNRLSKESWLLGYGFGTSSANNMAWFGKLGPTGTSDIRDFHSLYLCIPMIYGWIGGIAYLMLIVYIIFSLLRKYFLLKNNPLEGITLGFALLFIFFLANEIKIDSLRSYNYHYLIWILMGFALTIINTKASTDEDPLDH